MTILQKIIKEAKSLKKKFPKRFSKWTDYVKQASAIVTKKVKTVKKKIFRKKKAVKKVAKKAIKKVAFKKPTEKVILKKIHSAKGTSKNLYNQLDKLDEAQHKHMAGRKKMGSVNNAILEKFKKAENEIRFHYDLLDNFLAYKTAAKRKGHKAEFIEFSKNVDSIKKYISELKKHKAELKKLL